MREQLFLWIVDALGNHDLSPLQPICMLAYKSLVGTIGKYVQIGECINSTVRSFCKWLFKNIFHNEYLKEQKNNEINHLVQIGQHLPKPSQYYMEKKKVSYKILRS